MKRKHDALFTGHNGLGNGDARHSFAHSKIGQYLRGQDLLTEVKHLGTLGWGLVAKQQVRQGSLVLEFVGDLISKAEAQQRTEEYEKEEIDSLHFLHLSPSYVIDATRKGNKARYMRHAADANCQSQKWIAADNQPRAFLVALREIAAGEELTFNSYRQCSLGAHVRCMCGPVLCHSSQGSPVLQSQSETELMADAVLKCIQETNFGSLHDLQANQQTASRPHASTPPHSKQRPPCAVPPPAFASPPQATREDINALGLDSPDSFLDHLHRNAAQPTSSLQAISARCRSIIGQLADPTACTAEQQAVAPPPIPHCKSPSSRAGDGNSGAVLASSGSGPRFASQQPAAAQQQAAPGRLSRLAEASPAAQAEAGSNSPARQVVQQLQSFLAPYKHVMVGGYAPAVQPGQIQLPAPPYKPMRALKSVLGPRLQAGNVTSLDVDWLLKEAGWPPHVQPPLSHKPRPCLTSQPAPSPGSGSGLPLQPLAAAATCVPLQKPAASPRGPSLLSAHQLGSTQPAAAAEVGCALSGYPPSSAPILSSVADQQQSGEHRGFPHVVGSQAPANTPEQMQSCLVSLGLTSAQIQACLENAQRIEGCL